MTIITAIVLGLFISFIIIYVVLNIDKFKPKDKNKHQEVIEKIHSRIAKANGASIEQFSLKNLLKTKHQSDN
jgi:preprotein translocase subunit SecG